MILCDTNVWLALALSDHVHHRAAARWLDGIQSYGSVWLCRPTQMSLLRLLCTPSVLAPYGLAALSNRKALAVLDQFLEDDRIGLILEEPTGLEGLWRQFAGLPTPSPKIWMDAYLAAFALSGGFQFVTTDKAFHQFRGLDLVILA